MGDLISRSALMAEYCGACDLIGECWCDGDICPTGQMIKEIPAVDAVEVVRGEWMLDGRCSNCLANPLTTHKNFCPNCGADMRERRGDG